MTIGANSLLRQRSKYGVDVCRGSDGDGLEGQPGHNLAQQPEPLSVQLVPVDENPRDVSVRLGKTHRQPARVGSVSRSSATIGVVLVTGLTAHAAVELL
jgi:hypothetical protein